MRTGILNIIFISEVGRILTSVNTSVEEKLSGPINLIPLINNFIRILFESLMLYIYIFNTELTRVEISNSVAVIPSTADTIHSNHSEFKTITWTCSELLSRKIVLSFIYSTNGKDMFLTAMVEYMHTKCHIDFSVRNIQGKWCNPIEK